MCVCGGGGGGGGGVTTFKGSGRGVREKDNFLVQKKLHDGTLLYNSCFCVCVCVCKSFDRSFRL